MRYLWRVTVLNHFYEKFPNDMSTITSYFPSLIFERDRANGNKWLWKESFLSTLPTPDQIVNNSILLSIKKCQYCVYVSNITCCAKFKMDLHSIFNDNGSTRIELSCNNRYYVELIFILEIYCNLGSIKYKHGCFQCYCKSFLKLINPNRPTSVNKK